VRKEKEGITVRDDQKEGPRSREKPRLRGGGVDRKTWIRLLREDIKRKKKNGAG